MRFVTTDKALNVTPPAATSALAELIKAALDEGELVTVRCFDQAESKKVRAALTAKERELVAFTWSVPA